MSPGHSLLFSLESNSVHHRRTYTWRNLKLKRLCLESLYAIISIVGSLEVWKFGLCQQVIGDRCMAWHGPGARDEGVMDYFV